MFIHALARSLAYVLMRAHRRGFRTTQARFLVILRRFLRMEVKKRVVPR
jgi:hypothetical protein